jgi:hypothetical protein
MNLEINGKKYPLEWGMGAIEAYCDMLDCDITDIDIHLMSDKLITKIKAMNNLTLCAIKNGCENSEPKVDFDINYHSLQVWMERQPQYVADAIITDWKKSYYFGKTIAEYFFGEIPEEELKVSSKKKQASVK